MHAASTPIRPQATRPSRRPEVGSQNSAIDEENVHAASTPVCLINYPSFIIYNTKGGQFIGPCSSGPRHGDKACSPCWSQWRAA